MDKEEIKNLLDVRTKVHIWALILKVKSNSEDKATKGDKNHINWWNQAFILYPENTEWDGDGIKQNLREKGDKLRS